MTALVDRSSAYAELCGALDDAEIRFVVMRGHQDWPTVTGDLDLLVARHQVVGSAATAFASLQRPPFDVAVICDHVDIPVVWAGAASRHAMLLEADFATGFTWCGGTVLDTDRVLRGRRRSGPLWVCRPGDEAVIIGLPAILGDRHARATKGRARLARVRDLILDDPSGARVAWDEAVGARSAADVISAVREGDERRLDGLAEGLRARRFARNIGRHPVSTMRRVGFVGVGRARNARCGLWLAGFRSLVPLRAPDDDLAAWDDRLRAVARAHHCSWTAALGEVTR